MAETRETQVLEDVVESTEIENPRTTEEAILAKIIAGEEVDINARTRLQYWLSQLENKPNHYSESDNGKVVQSGALVAQTAHADVMPATNDQNINTTYNNSVKIMGDANLIAGNIKDGVSIFGVTGNYSGGGEPLEYKLISPTVDVQNSSIYYPELNSLSDVIGFVFYDENNQYVIRNVSVCAPVPSLYDPVFVYSVNNGVFSNTAEFIWAEENGVYYLALSSGIMEAEFAILKILMKDGGVQ